MNDKKMDFVTYQMAAARTANVNAEAVKMRLELHPEYLPLLNFSLGLAGESGEVADAVKKAVFHGHSLNLAEIKKELGDVLWYWSQVARVLGIDSEAVAVANVEKLMTRYPEGFSEAASQARVDIERCKTCEGRGYVPMGPNIRGLKACPSCIG